MIRIDVRAEFRKFDEETRTFNRRNDSGVVVGKEEYKSRVLRVEVKDEGAVCRLYEGVDVPAGLAKGDLVDLEVIGLETEKEVSFMKVAKVSKVNGKKTA